MRNENFTEGRILAPMLRFAVPALLAMLLQTLPPDLSQIFIKRYFQGYNSKELAEEYGLSPSGVRAALNRARKLLREKLKE